MEILVGLILIAVLLAVLWFVGYRGILPAPYDRWAMALAAILGSAGLWLILRPSTGKVPIRPEPEPVPNPIPSPVLPVEVPSTPEVRHVTEEARKQDAKLEETKHAAPISPDSRGTDSDPTGGYFARRVGAVPHQPSSPVDLSRK